MRSIIVLFVLCIVAGASAQVQPQVAPVQTLDVDDLPVHEAVPEDQVPDSNAVLQYVEQMPEYPGGQEAMFSFLRNNIKYPAEERDKEVQGTVYVKFVVDKTGKVRDVQALREVPKGPGLTKEAVRVVGLMPDWQPGMQQGKPVNVSFSLPVKFTLK